MTTTRTQAADPGETARLTIDREEAEAEAAAPMDLSAEGQRRYCEQLRIIPPGPDQIAAWYRDPACRQVAGLLDAMRVQQEKMTSAAQWIRSGLERMERRFAGRDVHLISSESAVVSQHATDYDMAVAAYAALENMLRGLVYEIRAGQGYQVSGWTRLEDHPQGTPAQHNARLALKKAAEHLAGFGAWKPPRQRNHLRAEHGIRPGTTEPGPSPALLHEQAHAGDLAGLRAAAGEK